MQDLLIKKVDRENKDEFSHIIKIRRDVFIEEQNCTEESEWDDDMYKCEYYLAYYQGYPCATLRYREKESKIKIERVAVLEEFRGKDIGKEIMEYILDILKEKKIEIMLHSQERVIGFYQKLGFQTYGQRFYEENIPHFAMNLKSCSTPSES